MHSFVSCRSVMAQMPTGTGKTVVLASVVQAFLRERHAGEVWIVAHRRELVEQIERTVDKVLTQVVGEENPVRLKECVSVFSIQWLSRNLGEVAGRSPSLVVIDEAHHALAKTYRYLWDAFPDAKFLGLTATPCRLNRKGFTDLFDTLVCSWSVTEFIKAGRLSLFDYVSVKDGSEDSLLVASLTKRGADGDFQVREMSRVLDNHPTIARLYESVRQYANDRKGIVYAINIEHARNIAAYYSEKGLKAVAIDSRTPMRERGMMLTAFRAGEIEVLVNVDIFSEGFDCPDVAFIQLARPTLSLAKYLQMVGRGLRMSEGKGCCVMIDNVGLYRMFGLPTVSWDWQAMFEGQYGRKGEQVASVFNMVVEKRIVESFAEDVKVGLDMGMVMTHECLERSLKQSEHDRKTEAENYSVFMGEHLRYGVRAGEKVIVPPAYTGIELSDSGYAVCDLQDGCQKIVRLSDGHVVLPDRAYRSVSICGDHIADACGEYPEKRLYIDLLSEQVYGYDIWDRKTLFVKKIGTASLLKFGREYYTRTRQAYKTAFPISDGDIRWHGYYYTIDDPGAMHAMPVCVLERDGSQYYWLVARCQDGGVYVTDEGNHYFYVDKSGKKERVGKREVATQMERGNAMKATLVKAERSVEPVRIGSKWGLKVDGRLVVPPIYKAVMPPKHGCCLVENCLYQWGVISLSGKLLVDTKYTHIQINDDGTADLTRMTGKATTVNLMELIR